MIYFQNYIHVDISLRINFLRADCTLLYGLAAVAASPWLIGVLRGGHLVTSSLSVICFANVQSVSGMLLHKQACSESFLLHPARSLSVLVKPSPD